MSSIIIGSTIGALLTLWDNATDYGQVDIEQTWFFGPIHVPTLLVDGGVVLAAIMGWALGNPQRPWVSEATVFMLLWTLPVALITAWAIATFALPLYNKFKEALALLPAFLQP